MDSDDYTSTLASLSVTHVYYDPNDYLSLLCAYLALLPQALCVVYATLIFSTREAEICLAFAGQLACEALNFLLKRIIKEERPRRIHGKGYGMPSSHAQFVAFWSISLALFLLVRHKPRQQSRSNPSSSSLPRNNVWEGSRPWSLAERLAVSFAGLLVAAATAWSRIYLNYHTTTQVAAGVAAGVVFALVWYVATEMLRRTGWLAWGLELPPAKMLRIRDLVVEEDMCQAGWERWEEKKKKKKGTKAN
ncbi:PAP2-domain-containing protein [Trichoderma citrinoviride]|uniref:Dolichyldiphosphatase n=1 Tax=Trichoderma citrinoviride TaxID=58853 RepID=A0A2T4B0W9_9HYPO|nr:PAP2-domain-containing protein [Trichoderma citrinoviride]PTB62878.1 PAP2-domain-containing protein [Trichoderma citrinoviride]